MTSLSNLSARRDRPASVAVALAATCFFGCTGDLPDERPGEGSSPDEALQTVSYAPETSDGLVSYTEDRERCTHRNPLRNAYFGELHAHTAYSLDAWGAGLRTAHAQAYRFARGERILLPPVDGDGRGTRPVQLDRPLDFAAVTDHAEWLGEVELCTVQGSPSYHTAACTFYREHGLLGVGLMLAPGIGPAPQRYEEICGTDDRLCMTWAARVWKRVQQAAESAYDRSSECRFTSFIGYEWSREPRGVAVHRNVIFRNGVVPPLPTSYFEAFTPPDLWHRLKTDCLEVEGCDVLAIPHDAPGSKGQMFPLEEYLLGGPDTPIPDLERQRELAALRARLEPLVELMQTRGQSECSPGLSTDEECAFEQADRVRCDRSPEICQRPSSFVRQALLVGLQKEARLGLNPYRLGFIGTTDTHNGTPGNVDEETYPGHLGKIDAPKRIRVSSFGGINQVNPGGLTGIWAVENSRDALFEAMTRRETFATSGPRIRVRLFGGFDLPQKLCDDPARIERAYAGGVPMGGQLPRVTAADRAPRFFLEAQRDRTDLQYAQIVKGWLDENNRWRERVYDVAGDRRNGASVDTRTCATVGQGAPTLCAVWTDPDFDPSQRAFYYARVLQNPTCRWSTYTCNSIVFLPPAGCSDGSVPKTIKERAWTSPIWYGP